MPVHNADIARVFDEMADILEIQSANPFRVRAYRNAARTMQSLARDVSSLLEKGEDLTRFPGIGKDLADKIAEVVETGTCQALEDLRKEIPAGLTELLKIPPLGPNRVAMLYHELDIKSADQLEKAARDGKIRALPGFGAKTEEKILETIKTHVKKDQRTKLAVAAQYAEPLAEYQRSVEGVKKVVIGGSYRRAKETVGDLDILVTAKRGSPVMDKFAAYEEVGEVQSKGTTRATVVLKNGMQVDVRVMAEESFGAALHYFTGSKAHNIAVRRRAQQRGLKISEYGVFKGDEQIAGKTEESVFKAVDLPWIAPELREDRGEIEAAEAGKLPKLIDISDLKGDLHAHTKRTDGRNTIEEMAAAAKDRGFVYLAITEHSKRLTVAKGLDDKALIKHMEAIEKADDKIEGITLLKGIEVDILEDGTLDLSDKVLGKLDLVIAAVHSKFNLSRAKQTKRILKAMDHPHFTILAHPSGRLLDEREPYDVDMPAVIRHARERGCYLELNAHPERLDLLDTYCQMAKDEGVLISVNSDAHTIMDFDNLRFGVGQARRGWLEAKDVLNTRSLTALRKLLKKTM